MHLRTSTIFYLKSGGISSEKQCFQFGDCVVSAEIKQQNERYGDFDFYIINGTAQSLAIWRQMPLLVRQLLVFNLYFSATLSLLESYVPWQ